MHITTIQNEAIEKNVKYLFLTAMGMFLLTIIIGILNGVDLIDFDRAAVLFHVHSGTLGWLSLSAIAIVIWYFSGDREVSESTESRVKLLTWWSIIIMPMYAGTIYFGFEYEIYWLPAIFGILAIGAFVGTLIFGILEWQNQEVKTTIHYLLMGGLLTATYGGIFGLILALERATESFIFPADAGDRIGIHAGAMEVGYLFLVISAVIEWQLLGENRTPIDVWGYAQLGFLWFSGFVTSMGLLLDSMVLTTLFLPLEILGAAIIIKRLGPYITKIDLFKGESDRYILLSFIFLLIAIVMFLYMVGVYFIPDNFDDPFVAPLFKAIAHITFIGAMTSAIFAIISVNVYDHKSIFGWADNIVIILTYIGLVGFVVILLLETNTHIAAVMGTGLLLGLITFALRMRASLTVE